ncbi:MAG TPA: glycosyltransferase [Ohtaekwangia sp.]
MDYPLVSCLCVTEARVVFLEKAIHYFLHQSYPNKELIVTYPEGDTSTAEFLRNLNHPLVFALTFPDSETLTLGKKRNLAIHKSKGKYFCVWDDDDWHHPDRLIRQIEALENSDARSCVLSRTLLYDVAEHKGYLSGKRQAWEATLVCEKSVIGGSLEYADLQKGEDSVFVAALLKQKLVVAIDKPELYIYTHHGNNTWGRQHWEKNIIGWGKLLPDTLSSSIEDVVKDNIIYSASGLLISNLVVGLKD